MIKSYETPDSYDERSRNIMSARKQFTEPDQPVLQQVMVISGRPDAADAISNFLTAAGYNCSVMGNGINAIERLLSIQPAFTIVDLSLPDDKGLEILEMALKVQIATKFIAISADGSLRRAIDAMKLDAFDYLPEPFEPSRLIAILQETLGEPEQLTQQMTKFEESGTDFQGLAELSEPMQKTYAAIEKATKISASVFITGESGTDKEICACAIHHCSPRRNQPFIAFNCAAMPKDLLESELFGHVRGAFTGAVMDRAGLATDAHGGTLFLDEICELDRNIQTKLLRLVEYGTFQRVGSPRLEKVDIRIVCTTNRNPALEVRKGRFRKDLLHHLQAIPIHLPPRREREGDIIAIAEHCLFGNSWCEGKRFARLDADADEKLHSQDQPGNVRELQNALYTAFTMNDSTKADGSMLPDKSGPSPAKRPDTESPEHKEKI